MKQLTEYLEGVWPGMMCESLVSDDSIWYRTGILHLNWLMPAQSKNIIKRYNISKTNPRAGVIRYMKATNPPIPKDSEEIFKRGTWDLDSLIGETEGQLMHKVYYDAANWVLKNHKKSHDVLTIMQCSSKKPYYCNQINNNNYYKPYKDYCDFACISNPGIIPIDVSQFYPYRYDEWNIPAEEKLDEIIDMTKKYRIVNMCRLIRFVREMEYKHVIVMINNRFKQWIFDEMYNKDIAGAKTWMHIVTTDSLRDRIADDYPQMGSLQDTRTALMPETRKKFVTILKGLVSDTDAKEIAAIYKEIQTKSKAQTNESKGGDERYVIRQSLSYDDFLKKFKDEVKDNMSNKKVDKGSNNLYYKSYYWSVLDLLLMTLDGDLVEDIDGEYWKLYDRLSGDKDFEKFGEFLFAYKPLMKNDDVGLSTLENEAYDMGILRKKPKIRLNPSLFK